MRLWHKHEWEIIHPYGYSSEVRVKRCVGCAKLYHQGVRGMRGQIIPYGFDAVTGRPRFGAKELLFGKGK